MSDPKNYRLLVVDDDTPTRMLLRSILTRQGYAVTEAGNGVEAVDIFRREHPDLVLLDVNMPLMNGFEACRRIRAIDHDDGTPVLMLTGDDDLAAIETAFNAGATDFITKPINPALISARVRYSLRSWATYHELNRNRMRQEAARQIARLGFWEWHLANGTLHWSDDLTTLLDYEPGTLATVKALIAHTHPDDRARVRNSFAMPPLSGERIDLELRLGHGSDTRIVRMIGERAAAGHDHHSVFGAFQDISASRRMQEHIDYIAMHDELTGLANRRLLIRQLRDALAVCQRRRSGKVLVAWIDLARFHRLNDALGESGGDKVLIAVAKRLKAMLGSSGKVARVGGDEFALLYETPHESTAIRELEGKLTGLDEAYLVRPGLETFLSYSAGIASFPEHSQDAEQLLVLAQDAQRQARNRGVQLTVARVDVGSKPADQLGTEHALRHALDNDEFHLEYQPQFAIDQQTVVGVEALLRWNHPERGSMSPTQFVPLLEESGLIVQIGAWVLHTACEQAAMWAREGKPLRVGINLSPRQFLHPSLPEQIRQAIAASGVAPELIELELTESLAMADPEHTINLLTAFREHGFKIAIDDFGIGHSSLEYLLRFPLDAIKIDRAFVVNITDTDSDSAIIRAVTAIGRSLKLSIIVEGVETHAQYEAVTRLGVNEVQGYFVARPMRAAMLERWLQAGPPHLVTTG